MWNIFNRRYFKILYILLFFFFKPRIFYIFLITSTVINTPKLSHCVGLHSSRSLMMLRTTGAPETTGPSTECAHTSVLINPKANRRPLSPCHWHFLLPALLPHDCPWIKWALICSFSLGTWLEDGFIFPIKLYYGLCDIRFFDQRLFPFISRLVAMPHMVMLLGIGCGDKWKFPLLPYQIFRWDTESKGVLIIIKIYRTTITSTSPTTVTPNVTEKCANWAVKLHFYLIKWSLHILEFSFRKNT